jgi:hypothetical protein
MHTKRYRCQASGQLIRGGERESLEARGLKQTAAHLASGAVPLRQHRVVGVGGYHPEPLEAFGDLDPPDALELLAKTPTRDRAGS